MKIKVNYETEVPDFLIKTDFCSTVDRRKCDGLRSVDYKLWTTCNRFSVELEMKDGVGRYEKCNTCKTACTEALAKKKQSK